MSINSHLTDLRYGLVFGVAITALLALITVLLPTPASAADLSRFRADLIIDDASFTDNNSMSVADIQNFLNQKNSVCLKDFRSLSLHDDNGDGIVQDSTTEQYGPGTMSAAELIKAAANIYKISPRVLLVTLQKEQGLVNRSDCPSWRYNTALGYGCPDTAACDQAAYGFTRQIDYGTYHFRGFFDDSLSSVPYGVGDNRVYFNPGPYDNANQRYFGRFGDRPDIEYCGSTTVNIKNRATSALYSYTPYQPNAASLAAGYGEAPPCGAYGNRNFYSYFNDWFNPAEAIRNDLVMTTVTQPDTTPAVGQTITYTVSFNNTSMQTVTLDAIGIVGRQSTLNGANKDFGWVGPVTLTAGQTQQFTFSHLVTATGPLYAWPAINYQGIYIHYNNWGAMLDAHQANITLSSPISYSASSVTAGQTINLSATIKNNEDQPIRVDSVNLPVRYYDTYSYDVAPVVPQGTVLASGDTQNISGNVTLDKPGPYNVSVSWSLGAQKTTIASNLINVEKAIPNFTLTYIEAPNTNPSVGEDVVLKFKLKNNRGVPMTLDAVGVVGRYENPYNGANSDFGWVGPEAFAANEEKSYTIFTRNISETRDYFAWVAINYRGSYVHYNNWGFKLTPHLPNLTLVTPLTFNTSGPQFGQQNTVSATVKNNEPKAIRFNALGVPIRYYGTYSYDTAWQGAGVIAPSGQTGDTIQLSGTVMFDKHGPYTAWSSVNINGRYITIGSTTNFNL
jgi:hypothetical protein